MDINEWRQVVAKRFPGLLLPAEICASVICQLAIKDIANPFGLILVDVPSAGKTIVLNFFTDLKDLVFVTDDFSAASFVSHAANIKKAELEKNDLLPKIKDKVLIVRDFSTIFGKREDDLTKQMGVLTRVFDGEGLTTTSGLHGTRGYAGKYLFMLLGACTPLQLNSRVWNVMGNFGSRLFFYKLNIAKKSPAELSLQLRNKNSYIIKQEECRVATAKSLQKVFTVPQSIKWNKENDPTLLIGEISQVAFLLATLRGIVPKQNEGEGDFPKPQIEGADRISQWLYNLARGHALFCGRNQINDLDVAICLRVALYSAPEERSKLFEALVRCKAGLTQRDVGEVLDIVPDSPAIRIMTIFVNLGLSKGILNPLEKNEHFDRIIELSNEFKWFRSGRFKKLMSLVDIEFGLGRHTGSEQDDIDSSDTV